MTFIQNIVRAIITISIILLVWFSIELAFMALLVVTIILTYFNRKQINDINLNLFLKISILFIFIEILYVFISIYYSLSIDYLITFCFLISFTLFLKLYFKNDLLSLIEIIVLITFASSINQCIIAFDILKLLFLNEISSIYEIRQLISPAGIALNFWATILILMLPFSFFIYLTSKKVTLKILGGLNISVLHFSIFSSCSRGAYISLFVFYAIAFLIAIIFDISFNGYYKKFLIVFFAILLLLIPIKKDVISTIQFYKTKSQQLSVSGRVTQLEVSFQIFKKNPLFGAGSNCFGLIYNEYRPKTDTFRYNLVVPNIYAQILVEKGLFGFLIFLGFTGIVITTVVKKMSVNTDINSKILYTIFMAAFIALLVREISFSTILNQRICAIFFVFIIVVLTVNESAKPTLTHDLAKLIYVFFIIQIFVFGITIYKNFENWKYETIVKNIVFRNLPQKEEILSFNNPFNNAQIEFLKAQVNKNQISVNIFTFDNSFKINKIDTTKLNEAIKNYNNAIKYNPFDDIFYHNLAIIKYILGRNSEALKLINKAIFFAPENGIYHLSKSIITQKDSILSQNELTEAIMKQPELLNSNFWIGYKQLHKNYNRIILKSIDKLKIIINNNPHHIFKARLGAIYYYFNQYDEAKLILKNVYKEMPNLPRVNYYLGKIHQSKNSLDSAKYYFNMSYQKDKSDALVTHDLANIYLSFKDFEKAKIYFLRYIVNQRMLSSTHATSTGNMYKKIALVNDLFPCNYLNNTKTQNDSLAFGSLKLCASKTNDSNFLTILNESTFEKINLEKIFSHL